MIKRQFLRLISPLKSAIEKKHRNFVASSALIQLLPLITAPIIARLYSPYDFGIYAVYYAIAIIISSISTLAFHNAILTEKRHSSIKIATLISLMFSLIINSVFFLSVILIEDSYLSILLGDGIIPYVGILPITTFLASSYLILYTLAIRCEYYSLLGSNKIILGISTMSLQILIGIIGFGAAGFIAANIIGYSIAIFLMLRVSFNILFEASVFPKWSQTIFVLIKNRKLVYYTMPSNLINTLTTQVPELMINKLFGAEAVGQYSLANRMINMPLSFISSSVQDIFRQKSSRETQDTGNCSSTFDSFLLLMICLSVLLVIPLVIVMPYIFPIIFGNKWQESGLLIQAMSFLIVTRFISSPLSYVWIVKRKEAHDLLWQTGLFAISIISFVITAYSELVDKLYFTLFLYSCLSSLWYIFCITVSFRFSRQRS
ncbi:hypothetical protein CWE22_05515 [Pseudidiomarina aestuarii]|uniref:Polysaccharide biosynthesis protein n=1 Tax=Pseudidiomarina aestuarii TaxID=624146 RepID=A0A7Z7ETZ2_9GAMM|nr:oligosaccharide flippase family protein [Pseudidiomarina aestuarii]RUO41616.1 hypothetical protein CWE22_05515 [Pseudidiomarina aestuarii]